MTTQEEGAAIIRRTEEQLQALLARAAERAEYDDLQVVAGWAKQLQELLDPTIRSGVRTASSATEESVHAVPQSQERTPTRTVKRGKKQERVATPRSRRPKGRARKRGGGHKEEYPKFLREGDSLVKIGWSKSEKVPYEHKTPRRVVELVGQSLARVGHDGRRFTTNDVLPVRDDSDEVPSYQAYLTLAWLRGIGLLVQHGRQGYSLPPQVDLVLEIERKWDTLVAR